MDEQLLESLVVQYLDTKGYERTAKQVRANSRVMDNKSELRLQQIYDWFEENGDRFGPVEMAAVEVKSASGKNKAQDVYGSQSGAAALASCNRVFLGNLSFKVDEQAIKEGFASCGEVTSVNWVTDKTTGKFYGSAFAEFDTPEGATAAAAQSEKLQILGRPVKVALAPHKVMADSGERKKMPPMPKLRDKPEGCRKLFLGNLSFQVTEEDIRQTFRDCGEIRVS